MSQGAILLAVAAVAAFFLLKKPAPATTVVVQSAPQQPPAQSVAAKDTFADILAGFTALANGVSTVIGSATNNQTASK